MSEEKCTPDWGLIESNYRSGILPLREIAKRNGITHGAITKRAKRDGWVRDLKANTRQRVVLGEDDEFNKPGFVYGVYLDDSGGERYYKIGMAWAFTPRFQAHQCASPFDICVAFAYYVGDMRLEERFLHSRFAACRIRGEWFSLSQEDLEEISKRALLV